MKWFEAVFLLALVPACSGSPEGRIYPDESTPADGPGSGPARRTSGSAAIALADPVW